jgi:translation initiation factor IF-2
LRQRKVYLCYKISNAYKKPEGEASAPHEDEGRPPPVRRPGRARCGRARAARRRPPARERRASLPAADSVRAARAPPRSRSRAAPQALPPGAVGAAGGRRAPRNGGDAATAAPGSCRDVRAAGAVARGSHRNGDAGGGAAGARGSHRGGGGAAGGGGGTVEVAVGCGRRRAGRSGAAGYGGGRP